MPIPCSISSETPFAEIIKYTRIIASTAKNIAITNIIRKNIDAPCNLPSEGNDKKWLPRNTPTLSIYGNCDFFVLFQLCDCSSGSFILLFFYFPMQYSQKRGSMTTHRIKLLIQIKTSFLHKLAKRENPLLAKKVVNSLFKILLTQPISHSRWSFILIALSEPNNKPNH